ncbi:hypothetical protein KR084_007843 [Drosophila pseudotakahashii]|nr:hypothetical protein KR084_007843 [Drosophila pseudotakahashii]
MSIPVNPEVSLEVEATLRAQRYTWDEMCGLVKGFAVPRFVWQLILCRDLRLSGLWLFLGLVGIDFLAGHSLPQLLGMAGLMILVHLLIYSVLRPYVRFLPYEQLLDCRINVPMSLDLGVRVVGQVANCINRSVATAQFLLLGTDLRASLLVMIVLMEVRVILFWINLSTLIKIAYCLAIVLPKLWEAFLLWMEARSFNIPLLVALLKTIFSWEFIFGLLEELAMEVQLYSAKYFDLEAQNTEPVRAANSGEIQVAEVDSTGDEMPMENSEEIPVAEVDSTGHD